MGPVSSVLCWSHARRRFFEMLDAEGNVRDRKLTHDISPIALETAKRTDAIFYLSEN